MYLRIDPTELTSTSTKYVPVKKVLDLQDKLNRVKSLLDEPYLESPDNWKKFSHAYDPYGAISKMLKTKGIQNPSNAFSKYIELFDRFPLLTNKPGFRCFFNAELPGSSLTAFNHKWRQSWPDTPYEWVASSFSGEGALNDDYKYAAEHPDRWLMDLNSSFSPLLSSFIPSAPPALKQRAQELSGDLKLLPSFDPSLVVDRDFPKIIEEEADETTTKNDGDMTKLDRVYLTSSKVGLSSCDLYSSDAGMDVSQDWNNQEVINYKLHLGCALEGLLTLKPEGNIILKQYTFLRAGTWELIAVYSQLFQEFYICKPHTSRLRNSEVYLVGLGFKGLPQEVEDRLAYLLSLQLAQLQTQVTAMPETLYRAAEKIFGKQTSYLHEMLRIFNTNYNLKSLFALRDKTSTKWIRDHHLRAINKDLML